MASAFAQEVQKYIRNQETLRDIRQSSELTLRSIERSGSLGTDILRALNFDTAGLVSSKKKIPVVLVIGRSFYARSCVVNAILGDPILPCVHSSSNVLWRTVRIKKDRRLTLSLTLSESFDLGAVLEVYEGTWRTLPTMDLQLPELSSSDKASYDAVAEVGYDHPILESGCEIVSSSSPDASEMLEKLKLSPQDIVVMVLFAIVGDRLSAEDESLLRSIQVFSADRPVMFVRVPNPDHHPELHDTGMVLSHEDGQSMSRLVTINSGPLCTHLKGLGFKFSELSYADVVASMERTLDSVSGGEVDPPSSLYVDGLPLYPYASLFAQRCLEQDILASTLALQNILSECLNLLVTAAYSMTWDMENTPRRLEFARFKEVELCRTLLDLAGQKEDEIQAIISDTIETHQSHLVEEAVRYTFTEVEVDAMGKLANSSDYDHCYLQVRELVFLGLNQAIAEKLVGSVQCLRDSYVGTLRRCLQNLEEADQDDKSESSLKATAALCLVLNSAYKIRVTPKSGFSFIQQVWEKVKMAFQSMPGRRNLCVDAEWRRQTASDILSRLSGLKLAKDICAQFRSQLHHSHLEFVRSLDLLKVHHSGRLVRAQEQRNQLQEHFSPKLARCVLECGSLRDMVLFGIPKLHREIGRGQFGVVFSCDTWAGKSHLAVKTVVPPDGKHWNDLALEFFYSRSIPQHECVMQIYGSVVDHNYGDSPAVYLVMDRMQRDLYSAIRVGMPFPVRLLVALDVIRGLRFLHSQGLIHRDVKLKNVLLDSRNHAKLTDLGFCKPCSMISGSVVGTPIHMAPELFEGQYDKSVDVYAFGVLFWYICAGHVRMPAVYEQCVSKDQLWSSVRRGVRPERLPQFYSSCWLLMEHCWAPEPSARPLLGEVESMIRSVLTEVEEKESSAVISSLKNNSIGEYINLRLPNSERVVDYTR